MRRACHAALFLVFVNQPPAATRLLFPSSAICKLSSTVAIKSALAFDRNIKKVIKPEHGLQKAKHQKGSKVFKCDEVYHMN